MKDVRFLLLAISCWMPTDCNRCPMCFEGTCIDLIMPNCTILLWKEGRAMLTTDCVFTQQGTFHSGGDTISHAQIDVCGLFF